MSGRNSENEKPSNKKLVEPNYIRPSFVENARLNGVKQMSFISNASVGIRASVLNG